MSYYRPGFQYITEIGGLDVNFEVTCEAVTALKLNIIDEEGKSLIEENELESTERHFFKIECNVSRIEVSLK